MRLKYISYSNCHLLTRIRLFCHLVMSPPRASPQVISSLGLEWQSAFAIIVLLYFYSHYFFASGAAHIGAMYTAFLAVATACGTPPMVAALMMGQLSNLMGCLSESWFHRGDIE